MSETPACAVCGKPVPYGEYIVFASVGQKPMHKRCVDALHRQATGGKS